MTTLINEISTADQEKLHDLMGIVCIALYSVLQPKPTGASLCIRNEGRKILYSERFRNIPEGYASRYDSTAATETLRLCDHPDHILGWQSNGATEKYQGSVRFASGLLVALCGFPAQVNEVVILWIGKEMGWISDCGAEAAAEISGNTSYFELTTLFNRVDWLRT